MIMGLTGDSEGQLLIQLAELVKEISGLPECRNSFKKMHGNLVRRIKLLSPLFEELRDGNEESMMKIEEIKGFELLKVALDSAKEFLQSISEGSKLYQALQKDQIAFKFLQMTETIEAALNEIPYDELDISEEVREQIELIHAQFRRAKGRPDSPDLQLEHDLAVAQKEKDPDPAILKRLSDKLQLRTINDLTKESVAFHELVIASGGNPGERIDEMASLLKKFKDYILTENPEAGTSEGEKCEKSAMVVGEDESR